MAAKLIRFSQILLCLGFLSIGQNGAVAQDDDVDFLPKFSRGMREFSLDLFKTKVDESVNDVLMSPYSIEILLSMVQQGAEGKTRLQLNEALRMPPGVSLQNIKTGNSLLLPYPLQPGKDLLRWKSRMYIKPGLSIDLGYNITLGEFFQAGIYELDFAHPSPKAAAHVINQFVNEVTESALEAPFMTSSLLNDKTEFVLVNAMYFKGKWAEPFDKSLTKNELFHVNEKTSHMVPFMRTVTRARAGKDLVLGFKYLIYPFETVNRLSYSMLFILPNEGYELDNVMRELSEPVLNGILSDKTVQFVNIALPKFEMRGQNAYKKDLQEMGVTDLFTYEANLKGITPKKVLVNEIFQDVVLKIDEEGVTAAAGSGGSGSGVTVPNPNAILQFHANRPFLFLLVENVYKIPIFMGKLTNVPKGVQN